TLFPSTTLFRSPLHRCNPHVDFVRREAQSGRRARHNVARELSLHQLSFRTQKSETWSFAHLRPQVVGIADAKAEHLKSAAYSYQGAARRKLILQPLLQAVSTQPEQVFNSGFRSRKNDGVEPFPRWLRHIDRIRQQAKIRKV